MKTKIVVVALLVITIAAVVLLTRSVKIENETQTTSQSSGYYLNNSSEGL